MKAILYYAENDSFLDDRTGSWISAYFNF
jgi:hypothetical protein